MKKHNLFAFILLSIVFISCNGCKKSAENAFRFDDSKLKKQYTAQGSIDLMILNPENRKIDSIVYFANDQKIGSKKDSGKLTFDLKGKKLGYQNFKALVYFEGEAVSQEASVRIEVVSDVQPKLLKYTIVNTFPHDVNAFTEGLEFYRDTLYESTGQKGNSYIRKFDYKTGKIYKQTDLSPEYFGEGITVINNKIFQLTWQENTGFIYDANTMKKVKEFTYDKKIEGWGMTNDGKYIYHGDGTEKIWKMDPNTQKMIDYINVYTASTKIKQVNELEYIDGKIYGNVWQKDALAVINPETGAVEGILDLSALRKLIKHPQAEVLNGIAYNPKTKTIFVTGKNWEKMFEIKVTE